MANIEYWIQLENRPWDVCPGNIDRMSGQNLKQREGKDPATASLSSPGSGVIRNVTMFRPLRKSDTSIDDALILRRYKPAQKTDHSDAWTQPDDRKVNAWDLNEPDPTDSGTMGTIPGPVIECNVGDSVKVHFRNLDMRTELGTKTICFPIPFIGEICLPFPVSVPIAIEKRTHSLHPHGFVFEPTSDGAFPLSPPDSTQPIPASEAAAWASVPGFTGSLKKGDRVPPGGTFTYTWNTFRWPTTAGVWLYHDHSICDMDNVEHGAIGIIVIHNPADAEQEVDIRAGDPQDPSRLDPNFLPGGSPNGSPVQTFCFPLPFEANILPLDLEGLPSMETMPMGGEMHDVPGMSQGKKIKHPKSEADAAGPEMARTIQRGNLLLELDEKLLAIRRFCISRYRTPPIKALYLQLFHTMGDAGVCINGRKYVGNTPTMIAGTSTRMRFGVVGMGSDVHTFHIHGHRWIIPGPHGNTPGAIQGSILDTPVSQFEDTRIFGPANSFVFTIQGQSGSFMRAGGPGQNQAIGEWHMHCHVLAHMMTGMMGSLLIINGGELAFGLPVGVPCPSEMAGGGGMGGNGGGGPKTVTVHIVDFQFNPDPATINAGDSIKWQWDADNHSTTSDTAIWDSGVFNTGHTFTHAFPAPGNFPYHCSIHGSPGAGMHGTVKVV
jgi:FtsP/CotA-like multicopper oxidase with cupredoxin domain/plastocyanin